MKIWDKIQKFVNRYGLNYEDFIISETDPIKLKIIEREKKLKRICNQH